MSITCPSAPASASLPSLLSAENRTGWYNLEMMSEIAANMGNDKPGIPTQGSEFPGEECFGPGGTIPTQQRMSCA